MNRKCSLVGILLAAVLIGAIPAMSIAAPAPAHSAQGGGNLLTNPGFEGLTCPGLVPPDACLPGHNFTHAVHIQDGVPRDNIETPEGWVTWWNEQPPNWNQPEVVLMPISNPNYTGQRPRIHSGSYAVKAFGPHGRFDGGFYQVVTGLQPGATVQLSAFGHTWSCDEMEGDNGPATTCDDPWGMSMRVGIESNGVADPFSPTVLWSQECFNPDVYNLVGPLTAKVGAGGTIVVYLRSWAKWATTGGGNDAYWDDAALVYASAEVASTSTPQPTPAETATPGPSATPGPTSTPRPTPTPRPDGAVVYVVEKGDTLSTIATENGVTVDQLRQLNAGSIGENDLILVGQELVIAAPSVPPTPTPAPSPTPAPAATLLAETPAAEASLPATATPTPEASPTPATSNAGPAGTGETPVPQTIGGGEESSGRSLGNILLTVAKISGVLVVILAVGIAVLFFLSRRRK